MDVQTQDQQTGMRPDIPGRRLAPVVRASQPVELVATSVRTPLGVGLYRSVRRHVGALLLIAMVIGASVYLLQDFIFGAPVTVYLARRADLTQSVVASGRVITPARTSVGSEVTGRVSKIPVAEGQVVKAGQPLVILDDKNQRAALVQAQALVAEDEARLRAIARVDQPAAEQALAQSRSDADLAHKRLARAQELLAKGYVTQSEFDDARNASDVADSRVRAAEVQLAAKAAGGSDEQVARTTLAQARAGLKLARANLDHTVIHAPTDGVLIARDVEVGDIVQPGKELMSLSLAGETQLDVQIDEKNLSLLSVGQKALASADAFPDRRFDAELFYINPGIDALRGSVEVKLRVPQPPEYLKQDMTISVDIAVARQPNVIVIPADAIRDDTTSGPWVLVFRGGHAERRDVQLGMRGQGEVEVQDGLSEGEEVIPPSGATVKPGQRVRIAPVHS